MSYRISYGSKTPKKYYKPKLRKTPLIISAALLCGIFIIHICFPVQTQEIKYKLFPWTTPESKVAINTMLTDIQEGASYEEAITAFCREILSGVQDAG